MSWSYEEKIAHAKMCISCLKAGKETENCETKEKNSDANTEMAGDIE